MEERQRVKSRLYYQNHTDACKQRSIEYQRKKAMAKAAAEGRPFVPKPRLAKALDGVLAAPSTPEQSIADLQVSGDRSVA